MEFRTPTVSPLRQRMLDDMRMRKLQPRTQAGYIRAVRRLTIFLDRAPDTATADDLRRFQLHLVGQGVSVRRTHLVFLGAALGATIAASSAMFSVGRRSSATRRAVDDELGRRG